MKLVKEKQVGFYVDSFLYAQVAKYCMENDTSISAFTRDLWRKKVVKPTTKPKKSKFYRIK